MRVIQQILWVLADGPDVEGVRLIVPQKLEQGDVVVREIDIADRLRGKEEKWWKNYLREQMNGEWKVRRDGEFLQFFVPLDKLLDALGRASWLTRGLNPESSYQGNQAFDLPGGDSISDQITTGFRRQVLTEAADNLQQLVWPGSRIPRRPVKVEQPEAWLEKCKKVIRVMQPAIDKWMDEENYLMAIIKFGILEMPLSQPIHHAPTTEFNPAVKFHNSLIKTQKLGYFGWEIFSVKGYDSIGLLHGFPLEKLGRADDLRKLALATLRLAIELPQLISPTRLPRVMHLLHENEKALHGLWNNTRIIVPEQEEATRIRMALFNARQRLLSDTLRALAGFNSEYAI